MSLIRKLRSAAGVLAPRFLRAKAGGKSPASRQRAIAAKISMISTILNLLQLAAPRLGEGGSQLTTDYGQLTIMEEFPQNVRMRGGPNTNSRLQAN